MEQCGGRVANGDDSIFDVRLPEFDSGGGAGVANGFGVVRRARIVEGDDDLIVRRQVAADNARADHFTIAQDRCTRLKGVMTGKGHIRREGQTVRDFDHAAGVDQARDEAVHRRWETVEAGLFLDGRERLGVNRGGVGFIGAHGYQSFAEVSP